MTSDFYGRTKDLFEEFKKRELQYLNIENVVNSRFHLANDVSVPMQDSLQMLSKREKENEETYKRLMSKMENLDLHADKISENLDKLTILRNSLVSTFPTWNLANDYIEKPSSSYNFPSNDSQVFQTSKSPFTDFSEVSPIVHPDKSIVSTQTDNVFCENCHFPLFSTRITTNTMNATSISLNEPLPSFENSNFQANENKVTSLQSIMLSSDYETQNKIDFSSNNSNNKITLPIAEKGLVSDSNTGASIPTKNAFSEETNEIQNNSIQKHISGVNTDESAILEKQKSDDNVSSIDVTEKMLSKSDDESLNHEFDFLESDIKPKSADKKETLKFVVNDKTSKDDNLKEDLKSTETNMHTVEKIKQDTAASQTLQVPKKNNSNQKTSDIPKDMEDRISESSISLGGGHSPSIQSDNVSAISDSDSLNEKEEQLKASAAYQALLGTVSVAKTTQKPQYSESDTEDEIEKALAKATHKSSNISLPPTSPDKKVQDTKKVEPELKSKPEPRKSISLSKPQQLSKHTRKVLGLDTSSGSEGEIKIPEKVKQTKIEEDSDEFDFYD